MGFDPHVKKLMRHWSDERQARRRLEDYVERLEDRVAMVRRERDEAEEKLRGNNYLRHVALRTGKTQQQVLDSLVEFLKSSRLTPSLTTRSFTPKD